MSCLRGTCTRPDPCQCVLVRWTDITSFEGSWLPKDEAKALKPATMETLGWIIHETDSHLVIASTVDVNEDLVGSVNSIPKAVISEMIPNGFSEAPSGSLSV